MRFSSIAFLLAVAIGGSTSCGRDRATAGGDVAGLPAVASAPVELGSGKMADAVLRRVDLTGNWSIEIDDGFTAVVTDDQITFVDRDRKVSVSSIRVDTPGGDAQSADDIRAMLGPKLEAGDVVDHASFVQRHLRGEAVIARHDARWSLRGFVAADGSVASCMIDFDREADVAWAEETWRSLRHP